eukprot:4765129-Pyramimonas_sp.AAC.1
MLDHLRGREGHRDTSRFVRLRPQEVPSYATAVLQGHPGRVPSRQEVQCTPFPGSAPDRMWATNYGPNPMRPCATSL